MKKIISEVSSKKEQYGSIVATVYDKNGNIKQVVEQAVDSFNRQIWRSFFTWSSGGQNGVNANFPITELDNTSASSGVFNVGYVDGQLGIDYAGIVVGSGTSQTSYNTVLMDSIIDYSNTPSSGTLQPQETTIEYYDDQRKAIITRSFINITSGSTVTINEVGIAKGTSLPSTKTNARLVVRDLLQSTLTVGFEDVLTVQYQLTISSGTYNYSNIFIKSNFGTNRSNAAILMTNHTGSLVNVALSFFSSIIANGEDSSGLITNTGNVNQSLVFGTSNTAFALTQIDLVSGINHGNGAGQLFYHPSNYTNMVENSTTNSMSFKITRAVENRSGSNISISEVGMFKSGSTSKFLLDRKVLSNAVTITNGNIVTFQWEFCYEV
jgi:hypothetical protein